MKLLAIVIFLISFLGIAGDNIYYRCKFDNKLKVLVKIDQQTEEAKASLVFPPAPPIEFSPIIFKSDAVVTSFSIDKIDNGLAVVSSDANFFAVWMDLDSAHSKGNFTIYTAYLQTIEYEEVQFASGAEAHYANGTCKIRNR